MFAGSIHNNVGETGAAEPPAPKYNMKIFQMHGCSAGHEFKSKSPSFADVA